MVGECIGIGVLLGKHDLRRIRVLIVGDLLVEGVIGAPGVVLSRHHLVSHILRNGKHLGGGQTHIQVVAVDVLLRILQCGRGGNIHFLIIRQHRGAGSNGLLPLFTKDGQQNLHDSLPLGLVLFHGFGYGQLAHGIGQQPVVLRGLAEIGQDHAVGTVFLGDIVRQSRRVADHGGLPCPVGLGYFGKLQFLVPGLEADVL